MLFFLLLLHAACGVAVLLAGRRLGRLAWLVGGLAPLATVVWLVAERADIASTSRLTASWEWVPALGLDVQLRVDPFAALMIVLVSGIGVLVFAYAWSYFGSSVRTAKAAGLLTLFAGSMLGVVVADNLVVLYLFWELTSITSYLLIGLDDADPDARSAAQQALLVTTLGGLVMLAGFIVVAQEAGTFTISELLADPPTGTATSVAAMLILVGAMTKSAQYPFHSWLPGAMVAPTPISAYLHSAAMVKAGVYLVARLAPAFSVDGPWRRVVAVVGIVTMLAGGLRALRPFDLKQLLAFGTISQLGFMVALLGINHLEATVAGCALLLAHGMFKAPLFMVVGAVDHETHTRDIREIPALGTGWGPTKVVALVSAASMAAVPPLAGFVAKEQAYAALVDGSPEERLFLAGIVAGSILTVAYSLRFAAGLLRPRMVADRTAEREAAVADHAPAALFIAPAAIVAAGSVVLGVAPALWAGLVEDAANALDPFVHGHLEGWHGFTWALALSLLTLAAGTLVFGQRRRVAALQARWAPPVSGTQVYEGVVGAVTRLAARVTSIVQSGSLRIYVIVIAATAVAAPTVAMLTGRWWSGWPDLVGRAGHVPIAAILVTGSLAATLARRRFAAALLLGVVGYGMALLFVAQGAPDLALTQFAVETLSVVVFLLVMRVLPARFERPGSVVRRLPRLAIAAAVGAFVVVMALASAGARSGPSEISGEMARRAYPEGDGHNIVNVILVDIRGMDTLGETTVLLTAAVGIVALARVGRAPRRRPAHRRTLIGRRRTGAEGAA